MSEEKKYDYSEYYQEVYSQDNPVGNAHGWIQWKGTDVCVDLHCICGFHGHIDADFFYNYKCRECGRKYAVGQNIKLIPLSDKQIEFEEKNGTPFLEDTSQEET